MYEHFIQACITTITEACVDQASSSTTQDGTTKETVSGYQALVCYIICFNKPASIVSTPILDHHIILWHALVKTVAIMCIKYYM